MFTLPAERCMVILYDFITLPAGCMIFLGDLKRIDEHWQPAFHLLFLCIPRQLPLCPSAPGFPVSKIRRMLKESGYAKSRLVLHRR